MIREYDSPTPLRQRPAYAAVLAALAVLCWGLAIGASVLQIGLDESETGPGVGPTQRDAMKRDFEAAHQKAADARSKLAVAEADLDAATDRWLARRSDQASELNELPPPADRRHRELEDRLRNLADHRAILLQTMTTEHPEVQRVHAQIVQLEQVMASIPRDVTGAEPGRRTGPRTVVADRGGDVEMAAARGRRADAQQRLGEAETAERLAYQELTKVTVEPPLKTDGSSGERERSAFWLTLFVTAAAVAVGAAVASTNSLSRSVFRSAAEVGRLLRLPVIGVVGDGRSMPLASPQLRLARALGEIGMATFLVAAALAMVRDRDVAETLSSDPLLGLRLAAESVLGPADSLKKTIH